MVESEKEAGLGSEMDKNSETHGMQDINYTFYHCMEITVEVRRCKYPIEDTLQSHWEEVELLAWSPRLLCPVLLLLTLPRRHPPGLCPHLHCHGRCCG